MRICPEEVFGLRRRVLQSGKSFDTCHDDGKNDYEFLPSGSYRWNGMKYSHKLRNMARVLADMGTDVLPQVGCAVIGLSEVENSKVLDDLTAQEPLRARGYKYVHVEGPDRRGVDCAMLYNPALFSVGTVRLLPYVPDGSMRQDYVTRGFLTVTGEMGGDSVCVIVCHWPSRAAGPAYRNRAAEQVKAIKDSLLRVNPAMKVMVMGDMNDDPTNKSMKDILRALPEKMMWARATCTTPGTTCLPKRALAHCHIKARGICLTRLCLRRT